MTAIELFVKNYSVWKLTLPTCTDDCCRLYSVPWQLAFVYINQNMNQALWTQKGQTFSNSIVLP